MSPAPEDVQCAVWRPSLPRKIRALFDERLARAPSMAPEPIGYPSRRKRRYCILSRWPIFIPRRRTTSAVPGPTPSFCRAASSEAEKATGAQNEIRCTAVPGSLRYRPSQSRSIRKSVSYLICRYFGAPSLPFAPADKLAGRETLIFAERDHKLEEARKRRALVRQSAA